MYKEKKFTKLFVFWIFMISIFPAFSQKVGGFYPNWYASTTVNNIQWQNLTDLLYAFGQPTITGGITISNESRLTTLVTNGHANNVKIHLSFGGAAQGDNGWAETVASTTNIQTFAKNVAAKVQQYNLDGINLDWEFPSAAQATGYTNLALEIRKELNALEPIMGKRIELSAAVAPLIWNEEGINTRFIQTMDYIYVMAFDDGSCTYCF